MKKEDAEAIALARYGAIASIVGRKFNGKEERIAEIKRVAASVHNFPGNREKTVTVRNVRRWLDWYQNGRQVRTQRVEPGLSALEPIVRADYGDVRALDAAIIDRAVQLRRELPQRTTSTLIQLLEAEAKQRNETWEPIAEATLAFHMRRRGTTRKALKREGRIYPRYEHDHRNAVWQGDWSEGILMPHPTEPGKLKRCHLHAFKDDKTRYIPHAEFYFRQNLPCLEDCFRKAILNGGVPEVTYVDNGAVYQAKQMQLMAARVGTQLVYATPYHPQGKGKIERFFGHVQTSFYPEAERAGIATLDELNTFFWAWLQEYYHQRVHSETGDAPQALWDAGANGVRWPNPATVGDLFLWEEERLVNKTGCVELGGNDYPAPEHLVGCRVSVRFDPFDLSQVRIFFHNKLETITAPQRLVSRTFRKAMPRRIEKLAPVESSIAFRKQMSEGYRQDIAAVLNQSRGQRGEDDQACLTRPELAALLSEVLGGRAFTVDEGNRIADFFSRYAPLLHQLARTVLQQAVEEKGSQLHLRFYLEVLRQARAGGRREVS
jgi:transposase InsO family protein